jgi:hypothetical protein
LEGTPWLCNCATVLRDAIDKHETAARSQPGNEDNENENERNQNTDACHENRMRNLADCLIQLLHVFTTVKPVVETAHTAQVCQPRRETNNQPFFYVERMKQNPLHQLERLTKRLKDFDLSFRSVHIRFVRKRRRL